MNGTWRRQLSGRPRDKAHYFRYRDPEGKRFLVPLCSKDLEPDWTSEDNLAPRCKRCKQRLAKEAEA